MHFMEKVTLYYEQYQRKLRIAAGIGADDALKHLEAWRRSTEESADSYERKFYAEVLRCYPELIEYNKSLQVRIVDLEDKLREEQRKNLILTDELSRKDHPTKE